MTVITRALYWEDRIPKDAEYVILGKGVVVVAKDGGVLIEHLGSPTCCTSSENFSSISCGINHALLVSRDRKLFALGSNRCGQCGQGADVIETFSLVLVARFVRSCTAGPSCSFYISDDEHLYAFGDNRYGQLGFESPTHESCIRMPTRVSFDGSISAISSAVCHTCIISDGVLYGCGFNSHGQLDFRSGKSAQVKSFSPSLRDFPFEVTKVSCGVWCTAIITSSGELYICGNPPSFQDKPESVEEIIHAHKQRVERRSRCGPRVSGMLKFPSTATFHDVALGSGIGLALLSDRKTLWIIALDDFDVTETITVEGEVSSISVCGRHFSYSFS